MLGVRYTSPWSGDHGDGGPPAAERVALPRARRKGCTCAQDKLLYNDDQLLYNNGCWQWCGRHRRSWASRASRTPTSDQLLYNNGHLLYNDDLSLYKNCCSQWCGRHRRRLSMGLPRLTCPSSPNRLYLSPINFVRHLSQRKYFNIRFSKVNSPTNPST